MSGRAKQMHDAACHEGSEQGCGHSVCAHAMRAVSRAVGILLRGRTLLSGGEYTGEG